MNAWAVVADPCEDVKCGPRAFCKSDGQEALCICEKGWTYVPGDISAGCVGKSWIYVYFVCFVTQ